MMSNIFRVLDRFTIADLGTIYTLEKRSDDIIQKNDIFEDLQGNHFCVRAIEMIRRNSETVILADTRISLVFELVDGVEVCGNILVRERQKMNFLFCNNPLYPNRVDIGYEEEYQEAGLEHACALFGYGDIQTGKLFMSGEEISGLTIYRGWMMTPEVYHLFYEMLEEKGIILINSPEEYERYHTQLGWYDDFKDITTECILKTQGRQKRGVSTYKKYREKYRVFMYAGRVLYVDDYGCRGVNVHISDMDRRWIEDKIVPKVKSNFVTVDIARKEDGWLTIVDFGDGQVSEPRQVSEVDR